MLLSLNALLKVTLLGWLKDVGITQSNKYSQGVLNLSLLTVLEMEKFAFFDDNSVIPMEWLIIPERWGWNN